MALVDILIPTYRRKTGLAVVLTSLLGQTCTDFDVIISDQTEEDRTYLDSIEIQTLVQALKWHGHNVMLYRHLPRNGLAEQRQFLLEQSQAPCLSYTRFMEGKHRPVLIAESTILRSNIYERKCLKRKGRTRHRRRKWPRRSHRPSIRQRWL